MTPSILYSIAVFFGLIAVYYFLGYRSKKREWKQKVEKWSQAEKRKSFIVLLGDRFDQSKIAQPMMRKLRNINVPLTPSEFYAMLIVGGGAITTLSSTMFNIAFPINLLIALIIVVTTYFLLFYFRKNKYEERFNAQLSEVCRLLSNGIRSGMTIDQGVDLVANEVAEPAGSEFRRLSQELRLGVDFNKALRNLQKRNPSRDFQLFVATLLIQKKAGGNLSAILEEMANTLEDRKIVQQTIKTMTAEQRYISIILPIMPVFLLLVMNVVIDGFLAPLKTVWGMIMGIIFLFAMVITFVLIRKVTNIRV